MRAVGTDPMVLTANTTDISHVVFLTGIYPKIKPCIKSTKGLLILGDLYTVYTFVI
jgi:hypothetical protein